MYNNTLQQLWYLQTIHILYYYKYIVIIIEHVLSSSKPIIASKNLKVSVLLFLIITGK